MTDPAQTLQPELVVELLLNLRPLMAAFTAILFGALVYVRRHDPDSAANTALIRSTAWTWREGSPLLAVSLYWLFFALLGASTPPDDEVRLVFSITGSLIFQLVAVLTTAHVMLTRRIGWKDGFSPAGRRDPLKLIFFAVACYIAVLPVAAVLGGISQAIIRELGVDPEKQGVVELLLDPATPPGVIAALAALAIVGAPIAEEILFRGIALPILARHMRLRTAIYVVSALFAAIHGNLASFVPLFALAVGLSLAYVYAGSIIVPVIMHMLFNGVVILLILLGQGTELPAGRVGTSRPSTVCVAQEGMVP